MQDSIFLHCAAPGCSSEFPASARGKRFCSDACRAKASEEAKFKRRLAHKIPELTADRRAVKLAAAWLAGKL